MEVEYGSIDLALEARVKWYDHLHRDDNPQSKTVTFRESVPGEAVIMALESQPLKIGQAPLTEGEKSRYNWAGANECPNIIEARCAKAAGQFFGVSDWESYWDSRLSVSENIEIMRREGTRELSFEEKAKMGELSFPEHTETRPRRGVVSDD